MLAFVVCNMFIFFNFFLGEKLDERRARDKKKQELCKKLGNYLLWVEKSAVHV